MTSCQARLLSAAIGLTACAIMAGSAEAAAYARVLLVSIDGMHAIDLANYVASHPQSTLSRLSQTGVTYTNAMSTNPSDSFPGLLAQVTGGSPKSTGVFYDDSFDRTYFPPGSDCKGDPGTEVAFAESIDVDDTRLDAGGTPGQPLTQIDPKKLPLALIDGQCSPVYPHAFNRMNTVFEVVKQHGGRTAWSDKHPAYEWLAGPSGLGLDDLFALEQDSLIPGTKVKTTGSFKAQRDFDAARVKAVLNEIKGLDSTGTLQAPVPQIFGLNFQSVSVGQKLPKSGPGDEPGLTGGYAGPDASPGKALAMQLGFVDEALGAMVSGLQEANLASSTLIIVSAKHGQSPVDRATLQPLDDDPYTKMPGYGFHIADDAALIWLKPQVRTAQIAAAADYLARSSKALGIAQLLTPNALALAFNDPAVDARTPDFIVGVSPGVVYTSGSKIAEHGGMNVSDRDVMLLVSAPDIQEASVPALVQTTQIAPTMLRALGYDPLALKAVQLESTTVLPGLPF